MTENEARKIYVDAARSYLGFSEASGKHRKIIDLYNTGNLPRGYRLTYADPWCCAFDSAVAQQCGMLNIIPKECGCEEQIKLWQKMERWCEDDGYIPKPGDLAYYDWEDDGTGDCKGEADHVGIVEKVSEGTIHVIEGNRYDSVDYRYIKVNDRYLRGFGLPNFKWWAEQQTKSEPKPEPWYIRDGSWQEATRLGLFDGNRPTANITRAEAAVVALRILKLAKGGE